MREDRHLGERNDTSTVEAPSSMPEGSAIKNKWKVHWDKPPVERKICRENTESHILFDWIKLIKQFVERGAEGVTRWGVTGEGKRHDRTYPSGNLSNVAMEALHYDRSITTGEISFFGMKDSEAQKNT